MIFYILECKLNTSLHLNVGLQIFCNFDVGLLMNHNRGCDAHSPLGFGICYFQREGLAFENTDNKRTNETVRRIHLSIVV
jgi:hypothetical protein